MIKPTQEQIDAGLRPQVLLSGPSGPTAQDSDQESEIVVTLEQLRPYERNPRFIRNPLYDDIKASIRERGLDQAPSITRRPTETFFVILNGGNTRLSILNELWKETRDERFFRVTCRYRPWVSESYVLLGHLVESDLHGQLAFIERALAVTSVKSILETDKGPLSQRELAHALSSAGYPVSQSQISRMFDTVEYLLPSLPNALCSGLPKPQIERLLHLRKRAEQVWNRLLAPLDTLNALWQQTLAHCDTSSDEFDWDEARGVLLSHMARALEISPRLLELELTQEGTHLQGQAESTTSGATQAPPERAAAVPATPSVVPPTSREVKDSPSPDDQSQAGVAPATEIPLRLDDILDDLTPDDLACHEEMPYSVSLPALSELTQSAAALPIADLRAVAAELAQSLAQFASLPELVVKSADGFGFTLNWDSGTTSTPQALAIQLLLTTILRAQDGVEWELKQHLPPTLVGQLLVGDPLAPLAGISHSLFELQRLPDAQLSRWIQLVVLARRIVDLSQAGPLDVSESAS